jgi:hypothetical protein
MFRHYRVIFRELVINTLASFTYHTPRRTVSQLKICGFLEEAFKGYEMLQFSMSATATQLLSSGEFCNLRYDTIPVKSPSTNVSFYTNKSKMPTFEL